MQEISIRAEELFNLGGFVVTNSLLLAFLITFFLFIFAIIIKGRFKLVPSRWQGFIELGVDGLLDLMDSVLEDRKKSLVYFPLIATIFLFVLLSNWLGFFPFAGPLSLAGVPLLRAPTSDLNFTIALAIIAVLSINVFGAAMVGVGKHIGKYINFHSPILFFVGLLELISEFVKIISFSFRLFGNIFAGEVLLLIVGFLVPLVIPLPFLFLEVFVGLIQAFIFAMLTLVFISIAVQEPAH